MPWYSSSSGRIELRISMNDAKSGYHQGSCDDDIEGLRNLPTIKKQLDKIPADILEKELAEYGAWEDDELGDHEANLNRILWLACGDIVEMENEG